VSELLGAEVLDVEAVGHRYAVIRARSTGKFLHKPGQFTKVIFEDADGIFERFYSIASMPKLDSSFELCVILDDPRLRSLVDSWRHGVSFRISPPGGRFHIPEHDRPIVCIAGGTGITPLRAIIEARLHAVAKAPTVLLYGCQSDAEIPFYHELKSLAEQDKQFTLRLFADQVSAARAEQGRPHEHLSRYILADAEYLLCGPPVFMQAATTILQQQGVAETAIHKDRY
jgi:ferredoxin-NADP reductase